MVGGLSAANLMRGRQMMVRAVRHCCYVAVAVLVWLLPTGVAGGPNSVMLPDFDVEFCLENGAGLRVGLGLAVEVTDARQARGAETRAGELVMRARRILQANNCGYFLGDDVRGTEILRRLREALWPVFVDVLGEQGFSDILFRELIIRGSPSDK